MTRNRELRLRRAIGRRNLVLAFGAGIATTLYAQKWAEVDDVLRAHKWSWWAALGCLGRWG